jgi:hypothetical protein
MTGIGTNLHHGDAETRRKAKGKAKSLTADEFRLAQTAYHMHPEHIQGTETEVCGLDNMGRLKREAFTISP